MVSHSLQDFTPRSVNRDIYELLVLDFDCWWLHGSRLRQPLCLRSCSSDARSTIRPEIAIALRVDSWRLWSRRLLWFHYWSFPTNERICSRTARQRLCWSATLTCRRRCIHCVHYVVMVIGNGCAQALIGDGPSPSELFRAGSILALTLLKCLSTGGGHSSVPFVSGVTID